MEKKYAIILFKGKEYLCGHEDGCHYDVSCPVRTFTEGEDDFKIQESGKNRSERTFRYHEKEFSIDTNNNPEAMEFLIRNSLAEDTGYRRKSGWVEYPMARLNLAELYRLSPESFENQE